MLRGVTVSGIAISPSSINGVTTDATTNKPVTAASLNSAALAGSFTNLKASNLVAIGTALNGTVRVYVAGLGATSATYNFLATNSGGLQAIASLDNQTVQLAGGKVIAKTTGLEVTGSMAATTSILSSGGTSGIGYATGAGGTVTQQTNRSNAVSINTVSGTITTDTTSLAAGAVASFTVNNTSVALTDGVLVTQSSGSNSGDTDVTCIGVAANSFIIKVANRASVTAETGAIVINFQVIKGVAA